LESPDPSKKSKFVRFSTPTETILRERLSSFRKEYKDPNGESDDAVLVVKALSNEWIDSCADLLTESFADSMGYMSMYKKFLRNQIGEYLNNHVRLLPKTVILVGIIPRSAIDDGQEDILAGTVEISFTSSTRTKHLTLNPPQDMPYLCNMAVQPEQRGKGYGRLLLDAAEQLILSTGYTCVYLHVRHVDPPALSLYRTSGFVEEGEDWSIIQVFGLDRRYLMRKSLAKK
jgi:GNAT superfamily N-acetyltransferase